MYTRYQAMMRLRDINTDESVEALAAGLTSPSPVLRHEIAFVYGQMRRRKARNYLYTLVQDEQEHPMVRHEAAEALGSIADTEDTEFLRHIESSCGDRLVRESCTVGIAIAEGRL
uniref:Deoxyhypusine hydroxylase n=1 Tax=Lygus hesperus TaxID=30085 RepID=A0A0A9XWN4_LYGHE